MSSDKCRAAALRYVSMQMKTEGQVKDYLTRKGYTREEAEDAAAFLREYKYIDDREYCRAYYRSACLKGRGRRRVEQELLKKKVDRRLMIETLDSFLSEENEDYEELIREILTEKERALAAGRRMLKEHEENGRYADRNFLARAGRRLISLGYESETVYSVIGALMKERKENE